MLQSGPDRVEYNQIGPSRGHKMYFFRVWSRSGQDITWLGCQKPWNLAPQDSYHLSFLHENQEGGLLGFNVTKMYHVLNEKVKLNIPTPGLTWSGILDLFSDV